MTSSNDCFGDLDDYTDEQKVALIHALHTAHHENLETIEGLGNVVVSLGSAMNKLAKQARKGLKKGKPDIQLIRLEAKLEALYRVALATVGMTPETVKQAEKFASIVGQLESDPTFNTEPTEEEDTP